MKKIYLLTLLILFVVSGSVAQQAYVKAPALQTTTTNLRAPNGTNQHVTFRGCYIIPASELAAIGSNTAINAIGFFLNTGASPTVAGTVQFYLQNTSDVSYLKGNNYATAIAPMTPVYNNSMVIPAGTSTITLPFPSDFVYTGGGLYVAMDWTCTGPFSAAAAVYQADNTLANAGAAVSTTAVPASTAMTTSNIRPVFRVGYTNTYTNEAEVYGVLGNGRQPLINGSPHSFSVIVRNNAAVTMTNVIPTLSVSGANNFVATTTIASIPAGGTVLAAFPGYTPTTQGMNTVAVILPADENNTNNTAMISHSTTCNYLCSAPPDPIANFSQGVGFSTNSGLLLNKINVPTASTLNALRLGIANFAPNAGNAVYGVITNNFGSIIATTNTITIAPAMFSTWQTFTFPSGIPITGNTDYYVGMAQTQNLVTAYFPLASMPSPSNNIPANLYATSIIGGGFISIQTPTLGWFAVESVFNSGVSLSVTPQTTTLCSGNAATLTASGATSYSWSTGANTSSISVSPGVFTVYTATGSAIVGTVGVCEDIKSVSVYVNLTPTINCPNGAICPVGGSFTLNPNGAATYTYAGGGPVVSPSVTSTYTITGASVAGCPSNSVVATVSVSSSPTVSISGPTLICSGASPLLIGNGATSYTWSNGSTFSSVIVAPTTSTIYTVIGAFGTCTASGMITMSVSNTPSLYVQSTSSLLCIGETATLSAFGANTYSWSTGQTGLAIAIQPSVETTYTLTGAINGICQQSITVTQSVISCVGIEENSSVPVSELKVYPNPGNGLFNIYVSALSENSSVQVINGLGQLILTQRLRENTAVLNLTSLPKGIYFIKFREGENTVKAQRVIIQ